MKLDELKSALQFYYDNIENVGVTVYAILKGDNQSSPVKIDIEGIALKGLKELFIESLRENISTKNELCLLELSSADERVNAIYIYDLEIPEELSLLEAVVKTDELPILDLNDKSLSSIKALLIEIGNNEKQIVLYKTMASVNIFGRSSFCLIKAKSRLEKLNDEFLRVSSGFQMIRIGGDLIVMDLSTLEKSFGFHDVIKREAALGCTAIKDAGLVLNPEVLTELIDDVRYARKLTKIAKASPVLKAGIPGASIITFCQTFPKLIGKIRFNEDGDKIILDTKVSKSLFIELLMDNFLTSELTRFHYESIAKDTIEVAVEN